MHKKYPRLPSVDEIWLDCETSGSRKEIEMPATIPPTTSGRRPRTNTGRTNTDRTKPSDGRAILKSASMPALPHDRQRETATLSMSLAPASKDWTTEAREAGLSAISAVEREEKWIEDDRARSNDTTQSHNKILFKRARDRLNQLASHRFGSLKAMFKEMKMKEPGMITLDEFSAGLKRQKLEMTFPRDYQRLVFEATDNREYEETLRVEDLMGFLSPDADRHDDKEDILISIPLPEDGRIAQQPVTDSACLVDKALLPDELHAIRDKIVDATFQKARLEKREDGVNAHKEYLINAFKQCDKDMSGTLGPDELIMVLGPKHLGLDVEASELKGLVDFVRLQRDGRVSYKEFVRLLEFSHIDPEYNMFFDHRNRELLTLKRHSEAPWRWNDDKEWDESLLAPNHEIPRGTSPRHSLPDHDQPYVRPICTSHELRKYNKEIFKTREELRRQQHRRQRPKTTSSAAETRVAMRKINKGRLQPVMIGSISTDWTRTGYGGDGVNPKSGLYLPASERYVTTSQRYYKPLTYGAKARTACRDAVSDAQRIVDARKMRVAARVSRNAAIQEDMAARLRKSEEMKFMNQEQRLKKKVM